jgi:hypothetical protein
MHERGSSANGDQLVRYAANTRQVKYRKQTPPTQDERLTQIIHDFEMKTEVVYKSAPAARVHNADKNASGYNRTRRSPLDRHSSFGRGVFFFNLILTVILPPVGVIRSVLFLRREDSALKKLGVITLTLGCIMMLAWFAVAFVFLP